ncbi:MAG: ABC transporter permease [Alphaproteobacteria bacterium]
MFSWALSSSTYFNNNELIELNFNSIKLILISSLLIICLSFFVNFGIRTIKSRLLKICSSLSISGYAIPGIVISVAIISFFSFIDNQFNINIKKYFIGSIAGLVLGYCIRFYSISFNSIKTVYMKINKSIDESALLLGFNKLKILKNIHFPLLKKNFIFAFLLISIEIIKELPITLILRPFNFETFSTKAFNYASNDLIEAASIPSLFIIFWSTVLIFLSIKFFLMDKK